MSASEGQPAARRPAAMFFIILAVLGAAAVVIPIFYNRSIQLGPELLATARERWQDSAPADYDLHMDVFTTLADGKQERDSEVVAIRRGRTALVGSNGTLLWAAPWLAPVLGPGLAALPPEDPARYGIDALFDRMEQGLRDNVSTGGRNYATASFDPADGHPQRYVHRVRGSKERVEYLVSLKRVLPQQGSR